MDMDSTTFLPHIDTFWIMRFLSMKPLMDWAKQTNPSMVILKLNFIKAYDKVNCEFLFLALEMMGMDCKFINMVQMLFNNAETYICLDEIITKPFKIEHGIKQSYPLTPYLFILVGEVFNFMVKEVMTLGDVKGILLPKGKKQ